MIRTKLLKQKIEEEFGENKLTVFYDKMGKTPFTIRRKMNGEKEFTVAEVKKIAKLLHLTHKEILVIFFGFKVD